MDHSITCDDIPLKYEQHRQEPPILYQTMQGI